MENNYTEAKKYIEKLRSEYNCKGDLIFRCAVQNVIEYGVVPLTQNLAMEDWLSDIDRRHDEAEANGKILWIGRDFEKAITECTFKLAKIGSMNLMMYIQREVWHQDRRGEISYDRAIELLKDVINYMNYDDADDVVTRNLGYIGFDEDEIRELGFGYLLDEEE
jgi:hypothetical protein